MACMEFQIIRLANNLELRHLFAVVEKPHSMLKYIHLILREKNKVMFLQPLLPPPAFANQK